MEFHKYCTVVRVKTNYFELLRYLDDYFENWKLSEMNHFFGVIFQNAVLEQT